jgi:hypothetical protein
VWWLIPAISGCVAGACAIVGIVAVLGANRSLGVAMARIDASPVLALDPARLQRAFNRIQNDATAGAVLLDRAALALREIGDGFRELRLREAVTAIRLAGVAVRLLIGSFR